MKPKENLIVKFKAMDITIYVRKGHGLKGDYVDLKTAPAPGKGWIEIPSYSDSGKIITISLYQKGKTYLVKSHIGRKFIESKSAPKARAVKALRGFIDKYGFKPLDRTDTKEIEGLL